jgi:hypothetical protein
VLELSSRAYNVGEVDTPLTMTLVAGRAPAYHSYSGG